MIKNVTRGSSASTEYVKTEIAEKIKTVKADLSVRIISVQFVRITLIVRRGNSVSAVSVRMVTVRAVRTAKTA